MPAECPNCRRRIPFRRTVLTTAWGRWHCDGCGSVLGVNVKRRVGITILGGCLPIAITMLLPRIGLSTVYMVPFVIVAFALLLYFLDGAVVHERRGFRCRECGYDLRGQREPRCPECGAAFDPTRIALMTPADAGDDGQGRRRIRRRAGWIAIAGMVVLFIALAFGVLMQMRVRPARAGGLPETRAVLQALLTYGAGHEGRGPAHAIGLAADGYLTPASFVTFDSLTVAESVPLVEGITLADFAGLEAERKQAIVQAAATALAEGTTAHRLGDFIFTYHGIDFSGASPDSWLVIWLPDPGQNPAPQQGHKVAIGLASGEVIERTLEDFSKLRPAQNETRIAHGLPPLSE